MREEGAAVAATFEYKSESESSNSSTSTPLPSPAPLPEPEPRRRHRNISPDKRARAEVDLEGNPDFHWTGRDWTTPISPIPGRTHLQDYQDQVAAINKNLARAQGGKISFAPFTDELDWAFSSWLMDENIGHNKSERLFALPEVRRFLSSVINNAYAFVSSSND